MSQNWIAVQTAKKRYWQASPPCTSEGDYNDTQIDLVNRFFLTQEVTHESSIL